MKWRWRNVPLPEPHLAGLVAGISLQFAAPWPIFSAGWTGQVPGWPLLLAGVWLMAEAVRTAGNVDLAEPNQIVESGPYAISRNPMYVAWSLILLGAALVWNTAWLLVALPAVLAVTHLVILREERDLEDRLGDPYLRYKAKVRRYL